MSNGRTAYPDIIDLPHHQSPTRPHMSLYDRAAQFASYKALSGYEDMVSEEARETDAQVEMSEEAIDNLNRKLNIILESIAAGEHPEVSITYFVPDKKKAGGKYVTVREKVKAVDTIEQKLILMSTEGRSRMNKSIELIAIVDISTE